MPELRVCVCNHRPVNPQGQWVLYWMTAYRRSEWNFALERAIEWAAELKRPLIIVEFLGCGGRWSSQRHHRFVLDGMRVNVERFKSRPVYYYPYIEPIEGMGEELLLALGVQACAVVADDFPMEGHSLSPAICAQLAVRVEKVDSNGLLPMRAADREFVTARAFRRFLQKTLPDHWPDGPRPAPLDGLTLPRLRQIPKEIRERWTPASVTSLRSADALLAGLSIDHRVTMTNTVGGSVAARARLTTFLADRLPQYAQSRNHPDQDGTSGLSPYLHFGNLSVHEVFHALMEREAWSPLRLAGMPTGRNTGWWGMSEAAEAFLDELITWRELGFNSCSQRTDAQEYASLPQWAQNTLAKHRRDRREHVYGLEEFEQGRTHDPLWNAAQMELVREGRLHNYMRMLWGKKILEWSANPQEALQIMIDLNHKYALDGQDPNSYTGIFWVLGRYDRPWGPERPVLGTIRYMSSANTARKVRVKEYVRKYAPKQG